VGGLIVLLVVLVVSGAAGLAMRLRQGRFRSGPSRTHTADSGPTADSAPAADSGTVLTAADLGTPLGQRATLVQFSSEVCAYCGPTRELLTEVARARDGLAFVEIDAAGRLDLARRLHIFATPTVLVLGADGSVAGRASGQPRRSDLLAAISTALGEGDSRAADE
jgi:thioredoxin-like negative regulator of GroEL